MMSGNNETTNTLLHIQLHSEKMQQNVETTSLTMTPGPQRQEGMSRNHGNRPLPVSPSRSQSAATTVTSDAADGVCGARLLRLTGGVYNVAFAAAALYGACQAANTSTNASTSSRTREGAGLHERLLRKGVSARPPRGRGAWDWHQAQARKAMNMAWDNQHAPALTSCAHLSWLGPLGARASSGGGV
jgi:hypothetical protein